MGEFAGLVAVVTGGSSGIGAETARLFAARGAAVAILDRDVSAAEDALGLTCDITDSAAVSTAIESIVKELGGIDIVVNNAGIGASGDVGANDDVEWLRVLNVNVVGAARVTAAALPHLRRSANASVVNLCSTIAFVGVADRALYSASKGAIASLTLAMAADHVGEGIRVNAVAPGTADTPWVARILGQADDPAAAAAKLRGRQPIGRLVSAAEVANAIAYLASPASASTTGTVLTVDGGMASLRAPSASGGGDRH